MTLAEQHELYRRYLLMKVEQGDWHGVADAAMDLRELEVQLRAERGDRSSNL